MVSGTYIISIALGVIPITIVYKYLYKEKNGLFQIMGIVFLLVAIILITLFENTEFHNKSH